MIRNHDWYNLNSTRNYPLDDSATGVSDEGTELPSNVIVDCHIRIPRAVGKYIYVSSVNVTENIVSVTLVAADSVTAEKGGSPFVADFTPLAVVTVTNPEEYKPYPLDAMYPGVGGWIVFGSGISTPFRTDFTTPDQSFFAPTVGRWYDDLPVPSAQKEGLSEKLTGLVTLLGSSTVSVKKEERVIQGVTRDAIVISAIDTPENNLLESLVGPCGKRPESGTCEATPIEFINTVDPDCDGNIDIRFIGELTTIYPYSSLSSGAEIPTRGLEIDFGLGITDACVTQESLPDDEGVLCTEYTDLCESSSSQSLPGEEEEEESSSSESSEGSLSMSESSCGSLPYGTSFDEGIDADFVVKEGLWDLKSTSGVAPESEAAESQGWGAITTGLDRVYRPKDYGDRNVAIWDSCDYEALVGLPYTDITRERRIWTDLYIPSEGMAGLVLNYRKSPYTGNPHYFFAGIDTTASQLVLGKFAGNGWTEVAGSGLVPLVKDQWYRLVTHVYGVDQETSIVKAFVYKIDMDLITNWPDEAACDPVVAVTITTNTFGSIRSHSDTTYSYTGKAGLFGWTSYGSSTADIAYFSQFNFDKEVTPQ